MISKTLIIVAIPSPLRLTFDYLMPDSEASSSLPESGCRVRVPFGKRELIGVVVGRNNNSNLPANKLKSIIEIIDDASILDPATLALYLWASSYYQFPLGLALQASLPKYVREGRTLELEQEKRWRLTSKKIASATPNFPRAPQQQKVFNLFKVYRHLSTQEASILLKAPAGAFLKALQQKEHIETFLDAPPQESSEEQIYKNQPLHLNTEQADAVTAVKNSLGKFHCFLLEGITGSGKTEVYLHLIAEALQRNEQVLVLVPEISLTPQTLQRFEHRFNRAVIALHSGINDSQRFKAWLNARAGSAAIIIGTRSAIFTPLPQLGLIIVDEEHDNSYKQQEGFRYNARDLAIYRGHLLNIPVLLGSATPSLESLHNAQSTRYQLLQLSKRAGTANIPRYTLLDLKGQELDEGFSQPLLEAIKAHLELGNQALVFINRRGYSPLLQCQVCGWIATCPRCETSYTLHQNPPSLRCHHCDAQIRLMATCPECTHAELSAIGLGTERSEKVLQQHFSTTPILRIDRDSTRSKNSLKQMLDTINTGKPAILIGTQMLAKGHHFPDVTLVAILDADSGLFSADFRGQEHMGQLLTQVAGRSGRGTKKGEVLIQTYHSTHPALNSLIQDGYATFSRQLLTERRQACLPPYSHLILFRAEASNRNLPGVFLAELKKIFVLLNSSGVDILGPMPAPMEKRAGRFRSQLLLQSKHRTNLHLISKELVSSLEQNPNSRKVRWSIDVDPIDFT